MEERSPWDKYEARLVKSGGYPKRGQPRTIIATQIDNRTMTEIETSLSVHYNDAANGFTLVPLITVNGFTRSPRQSDRQQ